jgi:hypothetical protein
MKFDRQGAPGWAERQAHEVDRLSKMEARNGAAQARPLENITPLSVLADRLWRLGRQRGTWNPVPLRGRGVCRL